MQAPQLFFHNMQKFTELGPNAGFEAMSSLIWTGCSIMKNIIKSFRVYHFTRVIHVINSCQNPLNLASALCERKPSEVIDPCVCSSVRAHVPLPNPLTRWNVGSGVESVENASVVIICLRQVRFTVTYCKGSNKPPPLPPSLINKPLPPSTTKKL